jgi:hypothetical protein
MREALQPYIGQRITVTGRVQRFGTRPGWNGCKLPTLWYCQVKGRAAYDEGIVKGSTRERACRPLSSPPLSTGDH